MRGVPCGPPGGGIAPLTVANGPVLRHVGAMMKVTVRVDVERHVRDVAARRLAAPVPNPTTVAAIEPARPVRPK